jgi:uncharacterized SAM-binding protein YcdF (DUF218 family)
MPLPFCLTLLTLGLLLSLGGPRRRRRGRWLAIAGTILLLAFSNKVISNLLILPLERTYVSQPEFKPGEAPTGEIAQCRYIVILGGGHNDLVGQAAITKLSSSALSRIVEGVRLSRVLPDAQVVVSGPAASANGPTHASILSRAAISLGLDRARIVQVDTARDTEDEAQAVKARVGDAKVALVTSGWHMPRAAALFRKAGVAIVPCPTDFLGRVDAGVHPDNWTWDTESIERSTFAVRERIGYLWVWLKGKV